jgi:hypothetical protein
MRRFSIEVGRVWLRNFDAMPLVSDGPDTTTLQ